MSFLDLVQQRRSCRRYSDKPVPSDCLARCVEAARLAPSACNSQPWRFIIARQDPLRRELGQRAFSGIYKMNEFARSAPVLVAVVRESSAYAALLGAAFRGTSYSLIDLGIACEHFVLQAQEEGLGTCWIGWFDAKAVKKILRIPFYKRVEILISLGYPPEPLAMKKNRKESRQICEYR